MRLEQRLEALEAVVDRLAGLERGSLIVVEGRKDVEALRRLGVECEVRPLSERGSVLDFSDSLVEKYARVVILTDWDRKGGQLARMLRDQLEGRVPVDNESRRLLAKYSSIRDVESLPSYLATLRRKLSEGWRRPEDVARKRRQDS